MKTLEEIKEMIKIDKEYQERKIKEHWENLPKFITDTDVPHIPIPITPFHIEKLINAGAIAKKDLKDGVKYIGKCRNAHEAVWYADKNVFTYKRHKFGYVFDEDINHFEDDNGYDLFVPIKEITGRVV
jgi:hypothetical protein